MRTVKRNQNNETSFVEAVFPSRQALISFDREIASTRSANRTIWYRSFYAAKHSRKGRKRVVVANRRSFPVRWYINYVLTIFPIFPFRRWINTRRFNLVQFNLAKVMRLRESKRKKRSGMKRRLFFKKFEFRGEEKKQKQLVERWLYLPFSHLLPRLVNKMQTRGNTKRDRILSRL